MRFPLSAALTILAAAAHAQVVEPGALVPPVTPTISEGLPGLAGEDIAVPRGRLIREGSFLVQREGVLVRSPTGEWIVVFSPSSEDGGQPDRLPPMVLLPNRALALMEAALGDKPEGLVVTLTGEVLVYHDRNYLLVTLYSIDSIDTTEPPASPNTETPDAPPPSTLSPSEDPRVQALIADLERRRTPGTRDSVTESDLATRPVAAGSSGRDGALMVRQRGRLIRSGGGQWHFAPDTDAEGNREGAIPLLPCQALVEIERLGERRGESLVVELSARRYSYEGRTALLPTMFLLPGPTDVKPLQ